MNISCINNEEEEEEKKIKQRIYLPAVHQGVDVSEYLNKYIEREFPKRKNQFSNENVVYSVPKIFNKTGEKQATLAEHQVFQRLHSLQTSDEITSGLWMTFFHSASYAGRSFRNQRIGKLIIREHDFVIFAKLHDKHYVVLVEVKSSSDFQSSDLEKISDSRVIKNNKRSAQHQLRDHLEVLNGILPPNSLHSLQSYIMWPFLKSYTKTQKNEKTARWKEDKNLHVFEDTISDAKKFNRWFFDNVISGQSVQLDEFNVLLNRFIVMSCGVFVDEIDTEMMALLTQEQFHLLNKYMNPEKTLLVVHGAAGTGKTLLVLRKLEQLFQIGELSDTKRALYICYWPGIRYDFEQKLEALALRKYVDTVRFFITLDDFLQSETKSYKHVFMDEAEALCLSFSPHIVHQTLRSLYARYHSANCSNLAACPHSSLDSHEDIGDKLELHMHAKTSKDKWGEFWLMVDSNQASLFLPKNSPNVLKSPSFILTNVMRSTGYIFNIFKQFYTMPMPSLPNQILIKMNIPKIAIGHHIPGPPVYWAPAHSDIVHSAVRVVIDLFATKGFQPKDLCVLPFLHNERFDAESINRRIDEYFAEKTYRPNCIKDVEYYLGSKELNNFLVAWALRVKGLEFKVVIMVIDEDDFDCNDGEDRKKAYIMASRCTTMLILVSNETIRDTIIPNEEFVEFPFFLDGNEHVLVAKNALSSNFQDVAAAI